MGSIFMGWGQCLKSSFSDLTLLGGWQEERPACKSTYAICPKGSILEQVEKESQWSNQPADVHMESSH